MGKTALQLHYTSCRRGLGGGRGFQTRALTEGLPLDDRRDVERMSGYSPPRDLPPEPSVDDIERDFPVAFRHYRTSSGRWALTRSQYTGRDYSTRWGNFFAHSLVFDACPTGLWPIDFYEWPGWRRALEPNEDTDELPPSLPGLDLASVGPSPSFSPAELQAFLTETPGRIQMLRAMIRAVFFGTPPISRVVVVRDQAINAPFWLACIQKAFPLRQAWSLTLSSYQFDGRDCAAINATTSGTDFLFDENQRGFQFCMFDLLHGRNSAIPDDGHEYAETVSRWMAHEPNRLVDFHRSMEVFDHGAITPDLVHPLRLQRLASGELSELTEAELATALSFVSRHVPTDSRSKFFPLVAAAAERAAGAGRARQVGDLLHFLAENATGGPGAGRLGQLADTWLRCTTAARTGGRWDAFLALRAARSDIAQHVPLEDAELARIHFEEKHLAPFEQWARTVPPEGLGALEIALGEMLRSARTLQRDPPWEDPAIRRAIDAACASGRRDTAAARALFKAVGPEPPAIAAACIALLHGGTGDAREEEVDRRGDLAGAALADFLGNVPVTNQQPIRRALDKPETWPVLLGEWRALLAGANDANDLAQNYSRDVLRLLPGFSGKHRWDIAISLVRRLSKAERIAQALDWITRHEIDDAPKALQVWCIRSAARGIELTRRNPGGLEMARELLRRARHLNVVLDPDLPYLRQLLEDVLDPRREVKSVDLDRLPDLLQRLSGGEYAAFLKDFLPSALARAAQRSEHGSLMRATYVPSAGGTFQGVCAAALESSGADALPASATEAALQFWLRVEAGSEPFGGLRGPMLASLIGRLAAMKLEELEHVEKRMSPPYRMSAAERAEWQTVQAMVADRRKTVWGRLTGLFRGSKG